MVGLGYLALAGSSATEPFSAGQSLGPVTASPLLGLGLLAAAALVFGALRRTGVRSGGPAQQQQRAVIGGRNH
jgi:hypothetical protein